MLDIRYIKKKGGKIVLQKKVGVATDGFGHVIFGWVDVEIVEEPRTSDPVSSPTERNDG